MWLIKRPWLAAAALAFVVRAGAAVATEGRDILPAYYFTDARLAEGAGWQAAQDLKAGRPADWRGSPSQRVMTAWIAGVYRVTGRRPLILKLIVAAASAAGVAALWWLASLLFDPRSASWTAAAAALWPSSAFYGSQVLKDPLIAPLIYVALACAVRLLVPGGRRLAPWCGALAGFTAAAFLRSYLLIPAAAALIAAAACSWLRERSPKNTLPLIALAFASPLVFRAFSAWTLSRVLTAPAHIAAGNPTLRSEVIPTYYDPKAGRSVSPYSPRALTAFRRYRQENDQVEAQKTYGRRIATQIYPDEPLETWLDVALFLPKSAIHALFMPLPGLYPLDGKPGRYAAAAENVLLLLAAALAALGLRRGLPTPGQAGLLVFFAVMVAGAGVLEFDLGSASRHKTLYLPLLFPFAAAEAARLLGSRRPS